MSQENQRWFIVARILRPRGNKGEVAAELLTDFPERLTELKEVYLGAGDGAAQAEPHPIALKACWLSQNHRGQAVFHFEGCHSISEAEKFRGFDVLLPIEKRVTLPAGQYFVDDLIGCSVFENLAEPPVVSSSPCSLATAPSLLGVVKDVQFTGEGLAGTPLLAVDMSGGELLIPLAEDICLRVNTAARRIDVVLPEGLRNMNSGS
ncbi:MAG: ribosome maturation factor RimM [Candidatus Acidiferrum sp.]